MILDDRHIRELLIAFTAIVLVWSVAFGFTFVSTLFLAK
jgi:hypothetical protein